MKSKSPADTCFTVTWVSLLAFLVAASLTSVPNLSEGGLPRFVLSWSLVVLLLLTVGGAIGSVVTHLARVSAMARSNAASRVADPNSVPAERTQAVVVTNRIMPHMIVLLSTIALAWYAWSNERVLRENRRFRDKLHMTDAEWKEMGQTWRGSRNGLADEDRLAASIALGVLMGLNQGETEKARRALESTITTYYLRHHGTEGSNITLYYVERYAATNASLSNAIYGSLKGDAGNLARIERHTATNASHSRTGMSQ